MMTADWTAVRRRLAVRRTTNRPPWGALKARHPSIVAPLALTLATGVALGVGLALARAERTRRAARARLPHAERRFGLLAGETAASGLQRIALGQLDLAIELLRGESHVPPKRAIHETRKALKRLRSLLALLEGEIGSERATRERAILRDAARALAGARDAEVMVDTLEELIRRRPRKLGRRRGVIELHEHLLGERRIASAQALQDTVTRELLAEELCALRARVTQWKLADRRAERLADAGLDHIYRAGRTRRRRAAARKARPRALHKWRKHVKDLRYALEALDVEGRSSKPLAKLAHRANALGELLGEEHDLMVLAERAGSYKPLKRHPRARKRLLREISRRRARLRKRALHEGERLYRRKPRKFARRVRTRARG
jgi:CHAD domain